MILSKKKNSDIKQQHSVCASTMFPFMISSASSRLWRRSGALEPGRAL
jgi:hypothetical protein